jgi:hypothetical protein
VSEKRTLPRERQKPQNEISEWDRNLPKVGTWVRSPPPLPNSNNNAFVAATSCHQVLRITPDGHVTSVLKARRPWSPTGIAIYGKSISVLEYTNANGPTTEGWYPRVRKIDASGHISIWLVLSRTSSVDFQQ